MMILDPGSSRGIVPFCPAVSAVKKRDCPLASASRFRTIPIREKNRHSLGLGWRKAKEAAKYSASTAHTTARIISANRSTTGSREYS